MEALLGELDRVDQGHDGAGVLMGLRGEVDSSSVQIAQVVQGASAVQ